MNTIHRSLVGRSISGIAAAILALLAVSGPLIAQSDTTFSLRELSSQFDQTGHLGATSIQADGRLIISENNGGAHYVYPISSYTKSGYPITVELNYCGAVNHTTFSKYTTFGNVPGFGDTKQAWGRFDQNRPLWLLSINGMGFQSLSLTTALHARPDLVNGDFDRNVSTRTSFSDADVPWSVDGMDYSNRLKSLSMGIEAEGRSAYEYVDVIRLLRADGSVLELHNSRTAGSAGVNVAYFNDSIFTGYYHSNSANDPTYALVEVDSSERPPFFTHSAQHLAVLQPRKLRLFKGDGTEMVYTEDIIPYGTTDYMSVLEPYGGMLAGPTAFYLTEINSNAGQLVRFKRSRHVADGSRIAPFPEGIFDYAADSTRGRALITEFDDHRITYDRNQITIQALGRTTLVKMNDVVASGGASETEGVPFRKLGYPGQLAVDQAALPLTSAQNYKSWTGYVTAIIDPEGRTTEFEYEQVLRRYQNAGFPYMPASGTVNFNLRNLRLKQVTEPTTRYVITYKSDKPSPETGEYGENDWIPIKSKWYGSGETKETWLLNNEVDKVEKYDCSGLLLTDDYGFIGQGGTISQSVHWTRDERDSTLRARRQVFQFDNLPTVLPGLPRGRNTRTVLAVDSCAGYVRAVRTTYDTLAPFIILPKLSIESINGIDKTRTHYEYLTGATRTFGGNTALAAAYGQDVTWRRERTECACDTATASAIQPGASTSIEYAHLAEASTIAQTSGIFDETATKRHYDSLYGGDPDAPEWEAVKFSPGVAVYRPTDTTSTYAPPVFGLEETRVTSDGTNRLRSVRSYTTGTSVGSTSVPRGLLSTVKISGQSGNRSKTDLLTELRAHSYTADRWLVTGVTGGLGAKSLREWSFTTRSGKIRNNHDSVWSESIAGNEYFPTVFEQPTVERALVRKPTTTGSSRTDTLTTLFDRTFHGLASRVVDANGWLSRFDYDRNGRLTDAWLPYDFSATATVDTFRYTGFKRIGLYGSSVDTTWFDTAICIPAPGLFFIPRPRFNRRVGSIVINNLPVVYPDCPGCRAIYGGEEEKAARRGGDGMADRGSSGKQGDRALLLATCNVLPWWYRTPSIAYIGAGIRPKGTTSIVSLDSAWIDLLITKEFDGCMNAIVEIPQFNFTRTYTFGCPPPPPSVSLSTSGAPSGSFALTLDECETALTPLENAPQGRLWRIHLTNLRDSLKAAGNRNEQLLVKIRTSTSGASMEIASDWFADYRPQLSLKGSFATYGAQSDGTLAYRYDDLHAAATIRAKVDDSRHTSSSLAPTVGTGTFMIRSAEQRHSFGGDYRVRKTLTPIGDPGSPVRIDSVTSAHNGAGAVTSIADQDADVTATKYDALGRPVELTNADGTKRRVDYFYGTTASFGLPPLKQWMRIDCAEPVFAAERGKERDGGRALSSGPCDTTYEYTCDFISATRTTDENGTRSWQYFDSYDRLRREVADAPDSSGGSHLSLMTLYDYDGLGRLVRVVNPKGDTTRYVYDPLGRVRFKYHPDLGIVSYAYDRLGNVRFSQTQEQADSGRLGYTEYDDLNRVTMVGEASIVTGLGVGATTGSGVSGGSAGGARPTGKRAARSSLLHVLDSAGFARLTDSLDGDLIYTGLSGTSEPTINRSLYIKVTGPAPPSLPSLAEYDSVTCPLPMNAMLGETVPPVPPFLKHPVSYYEPVTIPFAPKTEFENVAKYSHFVRTAVCYDTFPNRAGAVWSDIPTRERWDSLAPTGKIRNLKGREVAIAYREHGGEPFHYVVISFDERGRPEMLARWTENIGFDVTYYSFNSMNDVISTRTVDAFRQFGIWYGYDWNGRTDSVWSGLGALGSGFGLDAPRYPAPIARPDSVDVVYEYRKGGQIARVTYPRVSTRIDYAYSKRKWIDSIYAYQPGLPPTPIFKEVLGYAPAGQIIQQRSQHGTSPETIEHYDYDSTSRLVRWIRSTDTVMWGWDGVDNRLLETKRLPLIGLVSDTYVHGAGGPNRLADVITQTSGGTITGIRSFGYNANGSSIVREQRANPGGTIIAEEHFAYSYRERTRQFIAGNPASSGRLDWRYRYGSTGEREQKRLYYSPNGDENGNVYPWVYYLLGGSKEQIAVYHGQQTQGTLCLDSSRAVYFYPIEYLVHSQADATSKEALARVRIMPTGLREYRVADHVGSLRASIDLTGLQRHYDYAPFGELVWSATGGIDRLSFNDNEKDRESGDFSLGARHFLGEYGGFQSVDPLWDQEPGKSPYHYVSADPLRFVDPTGLQQKTVVVPFTEGPMGVPAGGISFEQAAVNNALTYGMSVEAEVAMSAQQVTAEARMAQTAAQMGQEVRAAAAARHAQMAIMEAETVDATAARAATAGGRGFRSFSSFKRTFGSAGQGQEWHHIVEQTQGNVAKFGSETIHNTENLVRLPTSVHRQISAHYSSVQRFTDGQTVRQWLSSQPYKVQMEYGRSTLERFLNQAK